MLSMVLILALVLVFTFGFFVVREYGRFLDENQIPEEVEGTDENGVEAVMNSNDSRTYPGL